MTAPLQFPAAYAAKLAYGLEEALSTINQIAYDVVNEGDAERFEDVLQRIVRLTDVVGPAAESLSRMLNEGPSQ